MYEHSFAAPTFRELLNNLDYAGDIKGLSASARVIDGQTYRYYRNDNYDMNPLIPLQLPLRYERTIPEGDLQCGDLQCIVINTLYGLVGQ